MNYEIKIFKNKKVIQIGRILNSISCRSTSRKRKNKIMNVILKRNEIKNIIDKYNEGYGYKLIARNLNITYSVCREFLKKAQDMGFLKLRVGRNITTDITKKFRKVKAIHEAKTETGFCSIESRSKIKSKKTTRGICGYYWNKTFNKYVWLRSSWEYIYATWLDSKNIPWDSEVKYFKTKNGKYLPDFFIYSSDLKTLEHIVEIKGFTAWDRGRHFLIEEDIKVVFISDIDPYVKEGSSRDKEIREWKLKRKMEI